MFCYVSLVWSESACEAFWNVQQLVYDYFFFVFSAEAVEAFTNHFDKVGRAFIQGFLPELAQAVDSRNRSPRL